MRNQSENEPEKLSHCTAFEALLPDAADGLLSAAEQHALDIHLAGCSSCAAQLGEAQRGAAWLAMLKQHTPEPPDDLLARILSQTSGAAPAVQPVAAVVATPVAVRVPFGRRLRTAFAGFSIQRSWAMHSRMAMTAAMAFFSIALTLNISGVRLSDIHAQDLTPTGLRRVAGQMSASAVRSFENNRLVYRVESRVSELRGDDAPLNRKSDTPF